MVQETGYDAYDHHRGETFDGTVAAAPGGTGPAGTSETTGAPAADTAEAGGPGGPSAADLGRRSPTNLRRRGWIYLILGIVITVLAIQRLGSGDSGALTILLLVIVALAAGHGFKFTPAFGRILAELALDGRTSDDISSFAPSHARSADGAGMVSAAAR